MKYAEFIKGKTLLLNKADCKITNPNQVKLKIEYCSICGYEIDVMNQKFPGLNDLNLGHEASATVLEIGGNVTDMRIGDKVVLTPYISCGECPSCRRGFPQYCSEVIYSNYEDENIFGAMREHVILNKRYVLPLPKSLSLKAGCLVEPLSVCIAALKKANITPNKRLLIYGCGAMGMLTLQAAFLSPVESITVIEPNPKKREMAYSFGASLCLDPSSDSLYYELMDRTDGIGFDAVIEASGRSSNVSKAYNLLARGGSLVLLSIYESDFMLPISTNNLYFKDASIYAVYPTPQTFSDALSLSNRMELEKVITAEYPFKDVVTAYHEKQTNSDHCKVVVKM